AVAGIGAVVALVLADVQQRHTFELVILLFVALAVVGVQQLGYVEFSEASRLLRRGLLDPRPSLQAHVLLRQWSEEIARAPDLDRIWAGGRHRRRAGRSPGSASCCPRFRPPGQGSCSDLGEELKCPSFCGYCLR